MFNIRLRELRENQGLTQEETAKNIDVARTTYAMYEQGKREPDYETLQKLADFFDVSIDYLLGRTNEPKHYLKEQSNLNTKLDISEQLQLFQAELKNSDHLTFDGEPLSKDTKESLLAALEFALKQAKIVNKKSRE